MARNMSAIAAGLLGIPYKTRKSFKSLTTGSMTLDCSFSHLHSIWLKVYTVQNGGLVGSLPCSF